MRLPALFVLVAAPLMVLGAACVDGATPDCSLPNSGCGVPPTDAAAEASTSDASLDAAADAADAADAAGDAVKPDAGDAGDAKTD